MASRSTALYLRVGTLVLVGAGLMVGFVLFLTSRNFGGREVTLETYVRESVQGLDVGSAVRYRGVRLGQVREIGLVSAEYRTEDGERFNTAFQRVLVRFTVDLARIGPLGREDMLHEAVEHGLRARITSQGITGVSYIELDFSPPDRFPVVQPPWRPRFTYIPSIPSTVAQVQSAAENLVQRLQDVDFRGLIENIAGLVQDLRREVGQEGEVNVALREATQLLTTLRGAVDTADLPGVIAELRRTSEAARTVLTGRETRQAIANVSQAAGQFGQAAQSVREAANRVPQALAGLDSTLRSGRGLVSDTQADLTPILRDLRAVASNLRDVTELLRRAPSQALFGSPPPPERR
ncbi:MlaD family protein [Roseomonas sp. NAR14]|uniref:MlaD family protein n=1 Tax=Roseomonas acroporae TaxID=2937791 RepID=A0A9X2C057_9PROT|nr:MlaD family protein [Roseomonas acroporae]MCK8787800.1 MlaD family protein [Roseomonas acroporae]